MICVDRACIIITFLFKKTRVSTLSLTEQLRRVAKEVSMTRAWKDKVYLKSDRGQQFMTLYMGVQRRLFGYVLSHIPNSSDADDIVQETVSIMWSEFDKYKTGTNFAAWALCIARYQILSYRKQITKKNRLFSSQAIEAIQNVAESTDNQE
ncbi:MAG: hypothetical protein JXB18_15210, partial [Sedimentisphaerales bacterium]|nr:hypothetical protein [Sedimentisphaerales bacterium]